MNNKQSILTNVPVMVAMSVNCILILTLSSNAVTAHLKSKLPNNVWLIAPHTTVLSGKGKGLKIRM
jgi:hypothetical protein